jgi:homogentisate solanesyltransferase
MATSPRDPGEQKRAAPPFECNFCDVEEVERLSEDLLVALAAACVEKTSGTFSQRAAVVPDVKKEMLEYLNQQSEAYANGGLSSPRFKPELVSNPTQIVKEMLESFVKSKRNMFSRVSGIVIDAHKDDKVTDFVRELDETGVWLPGRREALAKALLRRTDQRKTCHCEMSFESEKELAEHQTSCAFRPVSCSNEGCDAVYSAIHAETHDASCGYKLFPCYLECETSVQRKEMANHCATVCPMKKMKCPYHTVGCLHVMAQGLLDNHCKEYMGEHLLETLQFVQNHEAAIGGHAQRLLLVEKAVELAQRSEAVNVGNMHVTLKEQESKVKSLEAEVKKLKSVQKSADVSSEVVQLKRELQNLQKRVDILTSSQSSR